GFFLGGRVSDLVGRKPMVAVAIGLAGAGTVLMFTQVRGLFAPGFFLAAAGGACFIAVTLAYLAELLPTEIRATLTAFAVACQVAAGSVGRREPVHPHGDPRRRASRVPPAAARPARGQGL